MFESANKAVFLSYASQDAEAALRICAALRAVGVEVWFDQNELVGGDQWDQKIRGQVKACALFVPVISAATQARLEGYFRLEWKLAAQRTHTMADAKPFLLPVVIDATRDADAHVPEEFRAVQWTRLAGGETPPAFCARVKKLLGGEVAPVSDRRSETAETTNAGQRSAPPRRQFSRSWSIPTIAGAVLLVAFVAYVALRPRRSPEEIAKPIAGAQAAAANAPAGSAPAPAAAAPTEAQKLVAQARQIYEDGDELDRENLFLADDLVKRALALDSAEPSAWELGAALSFTMVWHSLDASAARKDLMMRQAARARALWPESVAAQLVMVEARLGLIFTSAPGNRELAEIERELIALAAREPRNWEVQFALGTTYRFLERAEDSIRAHEREVEYSGGRPRATADLLNVLVRRNRFAEAEAIVGPAVARQRTGRLLTFDQLLKLRWRGDLPGARAAVETWPGWLLREDRGAFYAWQTWLFSGQPQRALSVAQVLPRDYLRDHIFSGPRAVLTARAHELAGNNEAAQADWHTVVQLADRELGSSPDDSGALYWKAWALARLGDSNGARSVSTLLEQRRTSAQASFFGATSMASLWATVGRTDLALAEIRAELEGKSAKYSDHIALTRAMLEFDPAFAPLRSDPQFRELVASAPSPADARAAAAGKSAPADKSVAVLAFADLSVAHDSEYFSDGISEELINALGKVPGLKVPARTSSFYFKGKSVPVPEIAQQLGVAYVIEGSVQRAGDKVKIGARLSKAADGFQVWSDSFLRDAKDIFAVEEEIAGLVAKQLSLKLGVSSAAATASVNPQAFELYVQARQAWNLRNIEGYARAEECLTQALELDPNFATAHSALADIWAVRALTSRSLGSFGQRNRPEFARIVGKIQAALALDPNSSEVHASLGFVRVLEWKLTDAESELRRAVSLNPNNATAHHWLGDLLFTLGWVEEGIAEDEVAARLDPLALANLRSLGAALILMGRAEESLAPLQRALELQSTDQVALACKAIALGRLHRREEAGAIARAIPGEFGAMVGALAGLSLNGEALAKVTDREGRFVVLAALGHYPEGMDALDASDSYAADVSTVLFYPDFDPLRNDPRFQRFLSTLGLTEAHARVQAWRKAHPPEAPVAK